jgi:hypothetical protein
MISETGKNLSVLILTEVGKDWETFATWYSIYKNLPNSNVSIVCQRNEKAPFVLFQWAKRLKIPLFLTNPYSEDKKINFLYAIKDSLNQKKIQQPVLVVEPFIMILESFYKKLIDKLNNKNFIIDEKILFLNNLNVDNLIYDLFIQNLSLSDFVENLYIEANASNELSCIISYEKGCGRWINTSRGCPFSNAAGLVSSEMTANENRVIEIWKKMAPLYNAVN